MTYDLISRERQLRCLGWILYRARQACITYVVLEALVDLRIVEVSKTNEHFVGATEEFPYYYL